MSLTAQEVQLLQIRKAAGKKAMKLLKEKMKIKSLNKPWSHGTATQQNQLYNVDRNNWGDDSAVSVVNVAASSGLGNCHEKGIACYYAVQNAVSPTCRVYLCGGVVYDHVFVVVTSLNLANMNSPFRIYQLEKVVMVVDGWTEDFHFPNLGKLDSIMYKSGDMTPNPEQNLVRYRVRNNDIEDMGLNLI